MSTGGHWYTADGKPMHTIIGKNGKERATTLREARKLNLFPSVTTILAVQDKPMLTQWLINQLLDHCVEYPYNPHDCMIETYRQGAIYNMRKNSRKAADRGTEIHGRLEWFFKMNFPILEESDIYIEPAIKCIEKTFGLEGWIAEATFATNGFAGCVDLHRTGKYIIKRKMEQYEIEDENTGVLLGLGEREVEYKEYIENPIIIDFKTKDKEDINDVEQYDDHKMQLAAYHVGLKMPSNARRFNLFINVNPNLPDERKGECKLIECTDFSRNLDMFSCLHKFWCLKNKYKPEA